MSRTTLREVGELGFLRRLRRLATARARGVELGIGDDAAIVRAGGERWLLTTDSLIEGTHFRAGWQSPADLGRRAFAVNASDIAAMGGKARFALLSIALPPAARRSDLDAFVRGFATAARAAGCALVGGNLSAAGHWTIAVTVVGEAVARPLRRTGARPGDLVYVSGTVGGAAFGREVLLRRRRGSPAATRAFLRPTARLALGERLARERLATAAIDVSDGVAQDLGHVCRASRVGAVLDARALPFAPPLRRLAEAERLRLALTGGEDYELLFTARPADRARIERAARASRTRVTRIGEIVRGRRVQLRHAAGTALRLMRGGFDHFA